MGKSLLPRKKADCDITSTARERLAQGGAFRLYSSSWPVAEKRTRRKALVRAPRSLSRRSLSPPVPAAEDIALSWP